MKERTYSEPVSDMAASLAAQGQALLKCGNEPQMVAAGSSSYDSRPWAHQAHDEAVAASTKAVDASSHASAASAHLRAAEAMESRSSESFRLGWGQESKACAVLGAAHRKSALEHQRMAEELSPKPGLLKAIIAAGRDLLAKANVKGYTKADGTVVQQYSNKVAAAQHGLKMHGKPEEADADVAARRGALEAEGFKHKGSTEHAFGHNHEFSHDDGRSAFVAQMKPGVGTDGQIGVNSYVKDKAAAPAATASKKPGKGALTKQAKDEMAAASKGKGSYQKAADLFKQAGLEDKAAEATALAKQHLHDPEGQAKKAKGDTDDAAKVREQAKAAKSPEAAAALNELADAYEARSKEPESNDLTAKISGLKDKAFSLESGRPTDKKPTVLGNVTKSKPKEKPSAEGKATGATPDQLDLMEASLANDENSSDEELVQHFVKEGVPEEVAKQAVTHRDAFTSNPAPETGLLGKLMQKDASGKGGSVDAGDAKKTFGEGDAVKVTGKVSGAGKTGVVDSTAPSGHFHVVKHGDGSKASYHESDLSAHDGEGDDDDDAGDVSRETGGGAAGAGAGGGDVPPQADANEAGWDTLPDEHNPKHALSGMSSKDLGRMATMKPEHAKAHTHSELAARGLSAKGDYLGFDGAKAHHSGDIPSDFTPQPGVAEHMQVVKSPVLQAAAQGHLDLQKRARHGLAARGHDTQGNWVGFDKAKQMHLGGGDKGGDLSKAQQPDRRALLFVAAEDHDLLRRRMESAGAAARAVGEA